MAGNADVNISDGCIRLFVQTLTGRRMVLSVPHNGTVKDVKQLLQSKEHIALDEQRCLTFGQTPLQDDRTLESYNIQPDSTLLLLLRRGPESSICPECKETYDANRPPRVLSCLDVLCQSCVTKLTKAQKITCTQCTAETQVKQELLCAYHVLHIGEEWKIKTGKPVACGLCDNPVATHHCVTCNSPMCEECEAPHRKQRKTQSHVIQPLDESRKTLKPAIQVVHCPQHPSVDTANELTLFCSTCQTAICFNCSMQTHKGHDFRYLEQVLEGERKQLQELINTTEAKVSTLAGGLKNVEAAVRELEENHKHTEQEVKSLFKRAIEAIQAREVKCLAELQKICERKKQELTEQQQQLVRALSHSNRRTAFVQEALQYDSAVQLLQSKGVMANALKAVPDPNALPRVPREMKFSGKLDTFMECVANLGAIQTADVFLDNCVAEGGGLSSAIPGKPAEFSVTLRTANGEPVVGPALTVRAQLEREGKSENLAVDVLEKGKEGYLCRYEAKHPGTVLISVLAWDQHIPRSPFSVTVRKDPLWVLMGDGMEAQGSTSNWSAGYVQCKPIQVDKPCVASYICMRFAKGMTAGARCRMAIFSSTDFGGKKRPGALLALVPPTVMTGSELGVKEFKLNKDIPLEKGMYWILNVWASNPGDCLDGKSAAGGCTLYVSGANFDNCFENWAPSSYADYSYNWSWWIKAQV